MGNGTLLSSSLVGRLSGNWTDILKLLVIFVGIGIIMYIASKIFRNPSRILVARTLAELRESERSKAVLLSNLPGMAYRCNFDRDWTMKFVSQGCMELTGYSPEMLLNNRDITFNDLINEGYRDILWNRWLERAKDRKVFRAEYEIVTASGETKWVFEQGTVIFDEDDSIEALEGLLIDITEQIRREEQIRYLYQHDTLTGLKNRLFFDEEIKRLDKAEYMPLSIVLGDINGLKLINNGLGNFEGDKVIISSSEILTKCCGDRGVVARIGGDEFGVLLPNTTYGEAQEFMHCVDTEAKAFVEKYEEKPILLSLGYATKNDILEPFRVAFTEAENSLSRIKLLQKQSVHSSILKFMRTTLNARSEETEEHAQRMVEVSRAIGEKMGLADVALDELELLATLHDIGKIGISDTILTKPGKLTPDEWKIMKTHTEIGYRIALSTMELAPIAEYILCHHERWDGSGYPNGLSGDNIPIHSRIISVADAFDAMIFDRIYRKAKSVNDAIEEIKRCSGTQFDPKVVEVFLGLDLDIIR